MGEAGSFGGVQCGQCAYIRNNNHIKQLFIYFFHFGFIIACSVLFGVYSKVILDNSPCILTSQPRIITPQTDQWRFSCADKFSVCPETSNRPPLRM